LAYLNEHSSGITDLIPDRHAFAEGETGNNIGDGGNDMFDGGNILETNFEEDIQYTKNVIVNSGAFGTGSRYFTRKF
jgi:hypothetical protein